MLRTPEERFANLRRARDWWSNAWAGKSFMTIGLLEPVLGKEAMMDWHKYIRNCPPPFEHPELGHIVQEWGEEIASKALAEWKK